MEIVIVISVILALIVFGVAYVMQCSKTAGTIYVDEKDLDLYLELEVPIEDIVSRKKVLFNIAIVPSDSHE